MSATILVDLIQNHFQSHQEDDGDDGEARALSQQSRQKRNHVETSTHSQSLKFRSEKLRQDLLHCNISLQTSNLTLDDSFDSSNSARRSTEAEDESSMEVDSSKNKSEFQNQVCDTIINILNSILATIVSSKLTTETSFTKSNYYESSQSLMEHIACFVCTNGDGSLAKEVLHHMATFSSVAEYESIRCLSCSFVGLCSTFLLDNIASSTARAGVIPHISEASQHHDESLHFLTGIKNDKFVMKWTMECIDLIANEILIKRLNDKNQAVRNLAIRSSSILITSILQSNLGMGAKCDDKDESGAVFNILSSVVETLMWNLVHDPSHINRSNILQLFPIEMFMETVSQRSEMNAVKEFVVDSIVERVRDDKLKVRGDALDLLRKVHVQHDLTAPMRCDILRHGLSVRYPATLSAAAKMLCCGWMKSMNFDPIATLNLFEPTKNEALSEIVAHAIISTAGVVGSSDEQKDSENSIAQLSPEFILMDLSDAEIRQFKDNVMNCSSVMLSIKCDDDNDKMLNPSSALYLRVLCEMILTSKTLTEVKKANLLSKYLPDVTILTEVLERHLAQLGGIHNKPVDYHEDNEDKECFICLHLLKLTCKIDLNEEGSRRHLSSMIHRIISSPTTHGDLIESCVHVLSASAESEASFIQSVSEVLENTLEVIDETIGDEDEKEEQKEEQILRAMEILSVTLEKTSKSMSNNPVLQNFSNIILTTITDYSLGPTIRELGISCLGRFVILMDEETVIEKYKALFMNIASVEEEKIEIRAQALLAMSDLALLHERFMAPITLDDEIEISFSDILLQIMTKKNRSLLIVAAEIAAKLMCCGRLHDGSIISHLIILYFDQTLNSKIIEEDVEDVNEVGSPTRLQQMLTIFFPAYCMKSTGRETILASIPKLLSLLSEKSQRKGRSDSSLPVSKIFDYVIELTNDGVDGSDTSPILSVSVATSAFLLEEAHQISTNFVRTLCKILSKLYVDPSADDQAALKLFKRNLDELSMCITDDNALSCLKVLFILLEDVEHSDNEIDGEDDESEEDTSIEEKEYQQGYSDVSDNEVHSVTSNDVSIQDLNTSARNNIIDASNIASHLNEESRDRNSSSSLRIVSRCSDEDNLPSFATVGRSPKKNNKYMPGYKDDDDDDDDDLPAFAKIGGSHRSRKPANKVFSECLSDSESSESSVSDEASDDSFTDE